MGGAHKVMLTKKEKLVQALGVNYYPQFKSLFKTITHLVYVSHLKFSWLYIKV